MIHWFVKDENAMIERGVILSEQLIPGHIVYLNGDLGVGKTTLVKGILKGLGHEGLVTSPTYTLVEPYEFSLAKVFHLDLYRLQSAQELEAIGIRDIVSDDSICLIEWPDKGKGYLPPATMTIIMRYQNVQQGREIFIETAQ